ncbi:radical SAM protein, partial [candidate division WOR-3 bacterium]|nr:radical SAM protein [candidate division WOR-3 bacterium]
GKRFPELLVEIADIFKKHRIRFLTSHPKDFSESLIRVIADKENIMNSVHLPFQSGSDKILKMMHRGYLQTDYLKKINMLKQIIKDVAITTDVMTGFPFETEHDFNETMKVILEVRFDDAFMYKFSKRNYSLAGFMDDADENIKLRRLKHLIKIQNSIKIEKMATLKGKTVKVLIERKSKKSKNDCIGRDEGDRMIVIKELFDIGTVIKAEVIEIKGNTPIAIKKEE